MGEDNNPGVSILKLINFEAKHEEIKEHGGIFISKDELDTVAQQWQKMIDQMYSDNRATREKAVSIERTIRQYENTMRQWQADAMNLRAKLDIVTQLIQAAQQSGITAAQVQALIEDPSKAIKPSPSILNPSPSPRYSSF